MTSPSDARRIGTPLEASRAALSRRDVLGLLAAGAGLGLGFGQSPAGTVIRTVLADVTPESLGATATLFHEHLSFEWARVRGPGGRGLQSGPEKNVDLVAEQLNVAAAENVGCIVDAGTTDVGRDVAFLREVARRTRVQIVVCGGFYMQRTYPADVGSKSEEQLADDLARDARSNRHGAFGEIGEMPDAPMSADERKVFRSVGRAHLRTNLPIFTHNAYGTGPNVPNDVGLRQLDALESVGVKPQRVAIGHTCCLDDPSARVIKAIAGRGAFVGFDRVTGGFVPDDRKVRMLLAFLDAGFADNLLLSADYNFTARSAARPGYGSTLTVFVPKLRQAGVDEQIIRRVTIENPRRFLGFVPVG